MKGCGVLLMKNTVEMLFSFDRLFVSSLAEGAAVFKKRKTARKGGDYTTSLMQRLMINVIDDANEQTGNRYQCIGEFKKNLKDIDGYEENYLVYPLDFGEQLISIVGKNESVDFMMDGKVFGLIESIRYCKEESKRYQELNEWDKVLSLSECYFLIINAFCTASQKTIEKNPDKDSKERRTLKSLDGLFNTFTRLTDDNDWSEMSDRMVRSEWELEQVMKKNG